MEKYLHLFAVAIDSEGIPENIIAPRLKKKKSLIQRLFNPKTSSYTFICTRIRAPDT